MANASERLQLTNWVKAPQEFIGGLALAAVAAFALWASDDLQGMQGASFGPGTAPRIFGILLLGLGVAIALSGVLSNGLGIAKLHWRGPFFVGIAILAFAICIRPMGLVFSAMASFLISAIGSSEMRWLETIIVGACLTMFCALLFPYALGLSLSLWPTFLLK
jgi:putative tricarboxylic transport membrane protein